MQPNFTITVFNIGLSETTMVSGKEHFCKIQTSKTEISLFFGQFFNNLF